MPEPPQPVAVLSYIKNHNNNYFLVNLVELAHANHLMECKRHTGSPQKGSFCAICREIQAGYHLSPGNQG